MLFLGFAAGVFPYTERFLFKFVCSVFRHSVNDLTGEIFNSCKDQNQSQF